jgi:LytS/YehU family sensor histidine kinase
MLGGIAVVFAYLVYATPQMRETLVIASEEVYLCMFVALIFSMLSIVSGLLLMHGGNSRE